MRGGKFERGFKTGSFYSGLNSVISFCSSGFLADYSFFVGETFSGYTGSDLAACYWANAAYYAAYYAAYAAYAAYAS